MSRARPIAVVLFAAAPAAAQQPFFMGLGDLPGAAFASHALGVSQDGLVVVGMGHSTAANQPFRWTPSTGMLNLRGFSAAQGGGGYPSGYANAVSSDGRVVVGASDQAAGFSAPFRWTQETGMIRIGPLPGGQVGGRANATNADGSIVVGLARSSIGDTEAFRWTSAAGMTGLGILGTGPDERRYSDAADVSAEGSVIVGASTSPQGEQAFRWTAAAGLVGLGDLPGGAFFSQAAAVSADGSTIVGCGTSSGQQAFQGQQAFRWTAATGMVALDLLPGWISTCARAVSGDGSVVVAEAQTDINGLYEAFIWTPAMGPRSLRDFLRYDVGIDMTGWWPIAAASISDDGRYVVGSAYNRYDFAEAYLARLPEPATAALLLFALGVLRNIRPPRRGLSPAGAGEQSGGPSRP